MLEVIVTDIAPPSPSTFTLAFDIPFDNFALWIFL